ncbi:protein HOTHEAD-like isoform X3 [Ananas comosus]|uniref:Protein HOTHEAD-like isoform X1 n=1 Tax=Ananas comosus TaxID=4615 RepID=A0A6P5EM13_ANACO|nr:protein HOTHEAD-like isoform X1 [Ananas comosus]XP_020084498.1 protein HOTHEAD-like isoform X2 [Ananas comosus]XP_020084499.1 protein HOTHEAD-like isoform X3 [Ananas comosus]
MGGYVLRRRTGAHLCAPHCYTESVNTDQMAFAPRTAVAMFFFGLLCSLRFCYSEKPPNYTFLKHAHEAPAVSRYDYIVVGGGTAGCPLAATLSRGSKVLVLERGGSPYGNRNISNLAHFADTLADDSPGSPAQRFVSEDGVLNARARVLGGGSCLNAGFYTRASPAYVRAAGWDGARANASYAWVERAVAHEPPVRQWQRALRDGLLEAGVGPNNGFTYDHLYGTKVGGTIFDRHGNRRTAADLLQYAHPAGITVLLRATVSQILFTRKGRSRPLATGVLFQDSAGKKHRAYLNKGPKNEIIVSAGAIGSPQLLMLSGIGPREHLQSFGIDVVVDQPMVGQGMADNPMNAIFVPSPAPVEVSLIQVVGITRFGSFIEGASGSNFATPNPNLDQPHRRNFGMFSPQTGQLATVPPKQRTPEAIARAVEAMDGLDESSFRGGFILEKIIGPLSSGHLELRTTDPDDNPSVTFNYFADPRDLERCVKGVKTIERVIKTKAFSRFRYPYISIEALLNITTNFPVNLLPRHDNDSKSLQQYCKDTVMTIWHYHGGCQVDRVVDRDYRVLGVDALRVIDGSTFKNSPGTNPQATVMMLGRYMGIKIQNERLNTKGSERRP